MNIASDVKVIDADSHLTPLNDLWSSRAPQAYKNRVLHVEKIDGKQYGKGLSMHAHTELEYNLNGKYKDLKGILGIDPRIAADSQALVTIWCDGEKRFAEVITGKEQKQVHVSVKDVQTLKIVVASRNFLDLHDHVTFAEARVSQ